MRSLKRQINPLPSLNVDGCSNLILETGAMEYFVPAHRLYHKFGFRTCAPFADYVEDPNSFFMTLSLWAATGISANSNQTDARGQL
jgi:hypothetical protein